MKIDDSDQARLNRLRKLLQTDGYWAGGETQPSDTAFLYRLVKQQNQPDKRNKTGFWWGTTKAALRIGLCAVIAIQLASLARRGLE